MIHIGRNGARAAEARRAAQKEKIHEENGPARHRAGPDPPAHCRPSGRM